MIISDLAGIPAAEIRPEHDLRVDLGLDSLRALELLIVFADELGADIEFEEAAALKTVGSVLELARERARGA